MSGILMCNGVAPYFDSTKGSLTNRYQCSKEHIKNDLVTTAKSTLTLTAGGAAAVGTLASKNTILGAKAFTKVGKLLQKIGVANLTNVAKAGKYGILGLIGAATVGTLSYLISKNIYKKGQIDQKYTDSAKIESTTKNVILEDAKRMRNMSSVGVDNEGNPVYFDPTKLKHKPCIDTKTGKPVSPEVQEWLEKTRVY